MTEASISLYKETLSDSGWVPVQNLDGSARFAMLPQDVLNRTDLSPADKLVLAGLAMESMGTGLVAISHPAIAVVCGLSRSQVFESMKALRKGGLVHPEGPKVRQVQPYRLLHPRLAGTGEVAQPQKLKTRSGTKLRCPKCNRLRARLFSSGICPACTTDGKWDRRIDRKLDERGIPRQCA